METKTTILGRLFGAIWETILSVFAGNWIDFVKKLWKKVPDDLQDKVTLVVKIVENLKNFVDSPGAKILVEVIPGEIDDKLRAWLSDNLGDILSELRLLDIPSSQYSNQELHSIASTLTERLTGLSYGQSALTTEVGYQNFKAA